MDRTAAAACATTVAGPLATPVRPNDLAVLFPPGSWQLTDAKIINSSNQALLLWKDYDTNHGNGWVDLTPLTVIYMPDETVTDPVERLRHAVVMEVPQGAKLRFDRPLDLNKGGGIGRLIEGRLRGPVTIHSQGKQPDHQDDLLVETHDVELSEQRITTANDVDFHWGPNSGHGRQMEIKLLPRLGPRGGDQEGPNIGGIEQFQLEHVERMHLDMGSTSAADHGHMVPAKPSGPGVPAHGPAGTPMLGTLSAHAAPVEITCRGPFCFNLVEQKATFRDQVDVLRIQPNGPADHMSCELLSIFFARPTPPPGHPQAGTRPPAKKGAPGFDLKPTRIEAQGTPTTLDAPLDHLQVRAERLQYNLIDGQIYLEDAQEVMLHKDANEIRTPSLRYTPGPPDHTERFQLLAGGPGWLRGEMADRPGQQLKARWRQKLEVRPQEQNQVISLLGGATLDFQAMGQLDAQEIHFWLRESPANLSSPSGSRTGGEGSLEPDRLLAEGNVVGKSPQFALQVQRLEAWFTKPPPGAPAATATGVAANGLPAPYVPSTLAGPALTPGEGGVPAPAAAAAPSPASLPTATQGVPRYPPLGGQDPASAAGRQAHMEISGRLLQARVLLRDKQPGESTEITGDPVAAAKAREERDQQHGELTEVTVIDNVKLQETQTALPGELPLLVTGQWLHATEANTPRTKVTVKGEPAHMEGRGMSLTGPNIQIDRGANLLTMEGPGRMEKFLDRDLEDRPLSQPGNVKIDWQKGMVFDGRKAHFQDSVNVIGNSQLLQAGWLDVYFQQPISFSNPRPQPGVAGAPPPSQVERLLCGDGVFVENRTIEAGQQASYDRIQLKNLEMNNISGDFHADGPGWLVSVRRGTSEGFSLPGGPLAAPGRPAAVGHHVPTVAVGLGPPQPGPTDPNQLTCIHLRFMRSLTGNRLRNDIAFHGQVHAAVAPAQSWTTTLDSDDPTRLGPQACVLRCDNLQVGKMGPLSGGSGGNLELTALDNVVAEGTDFLARCARLTYTQAKELLILEGDGRSDAELYQQKGGEGTDASPLKAQKILYFRKTGQAKVEGLHSLETNQAPSKPAASGRK